MSEYLKKQAVLEWLDDRRYKSPWIESFRDRLESGAFDADTSEVQRLRAALHKITQIYDDHNLHDLIACYEMNRVAKEALSTTSEQAERVREHDWVSTPVDANDLIGDLIDERCPKCGADMLGNKVGDKWCSLVGCDYDINAPEGGGNDA